MTAGELIAELLNYPADMPVYVMLSDEFGTHEATQVWVEQRPRYGHPARLEIL